MNTQIIKPHDRFSTTKYIKTSVSYVERGTECPPHRSLVHNDWLQETSPPGLDPNSSCISNMSLRCKMIQQCCISQDFRLKKLQSAALGEQQPNNQSVPTKAWCVSFNFPCLIQNKNTRTMFFFLVKSLLGFFPGHTRFARRFDGSKST